MSELNVGDVSIATAIDKLRNREWLAPRFQREFVWEIPDILALATSIIDAHPIGMITLWEQGDDSTLELERLSIADWDSSTQSTQPNFFGSDNADPRQVLAILDGRQRCTSIVMAFAGFRQESGLYKFAGRYFLDVTSDDPYERIVYFKKGELDQKGLTTEAACVSQGLFPLASFQEDEGFLYQWMRYLQILRDPSYYPDNQLPDDDELERRDQILKEAHKGLAETKLAVYVVPGSYDLGQICDIFETLNTTGTKVSTVDLIHSWIYSDTVDSREGPLEIREWIRDVGQRDGAIGWAVVEKRPELIAQIVTACHIALVRKKDVARSIRSSAAPQITSVKSPDLLATPSKHWQHVITNDSKFAQFLADFQKVVAEGFFPYEKCPYPASASIYVGLRWHKQFDAARSHQKWNVEDLNALFRAFFWRNALSGRYDQGFLTQLGTDLKVLKEFLQKRGDFGSASTWAHEIQPKLEQHMNKPVPSDDQLIDILTNGRPGGAMQSAVQLPMIAGARNDFFSGDDISFPGGQATQLHHIYHRSWCNNNRSGELRDILDSDRANKDWVNSTANLMPLSRHSNNEWKAKIPRMFLEEHKVKFSSVKQALRPALIDQTGFGLLLKGPSKITEFWTHRARLIAELLSANTSIRY